MDNNQSAYDRQRWCCEQCQRRCRGRMHVIKAGDTLYSLSRMYNVSVPEIMRANPFINIYNLRINDEICIPNMRMPFNEMPDDYFFEMDNMNNAGQNMGLDGNTNMSGTVNGMSNNSFSEDDSVKDMLKKLDMTMEELLSCINQK